MCVRRTPSWRKSRGAGVTDDTGTLISEQRYLPFGGVRQLGGSFITQTDYGYTGQRNLGDMGLMDYKARFYSPMLGRFTQPDTLIPNPGNQQAFNRFSYGLNNPSRYTDPTGHKACSIDENGDCDDTEEKIYKFFDRVDKQILNGKKDGLKAKNKDDVLGAMIKVVERAAYIFGNDWNTFLDATNYIFTGYYGHGSGSMWGAHKSSFSGYFDGDSGFDFDFQDRDNQVRHFWAAFATAADPYGDNPSGATWAEDGSWWHDIATDGFGKDDATIMDYELSITGIDIAAQVGKEIKNPSDLAEVLYYRLGTDGPGYIGPYVDPSWWITPRD